MTTNKKPALRVVSKENTRSTTNKSPKISLVDLLKFAEGVSDIESGHTKPVIKVSEIASFGTANEVQNSQLRKAAD
jgi:hypothetical protein